MYAHEQEKERVGGREKETKKDNVCEREYVYVYRGLRHSREVLS